MTRSPTTEARDHSATGHDFVETTSPQGVLVPAAEQVADRAYQYYQNHGAAGGRDVQDWLQAEAELTVEWRLMAEEPEVSATQPEDL